MLVPRSVFPPGKSAVLEMRDLACFDREATRIARSWEAASQGLVHLTTINAARHLVSMKPTFADSLLCVDLRPVLHGMQSEINLWYRPLVFDCSFYVSVHDGEFVAHLALCGKVWVGMT